ncbi:hypothetical protein LPJ79_001242 [Coemansia sp. RSA 1821]|nr:hypothetical protein LPJ79_001242 [Coemansia sp. RSA 1821]
MNNHNNQNTGCSIDDELIEKELEEFDRLMSDEVIYISDTSEAGEGFEQTGNSSTTAETSLPFPDGAVKLTHMQGETPTEDCMTLEDILQPHKLRKALLSTFILEMDWLEPKFAKSTKLVIVKSYNPDEEPSGVLQTENGRITLINPLFGKQKYPIMHSKLMLLFYDNYVRFVASSANLIQIDWTVLQNIVYIQDMKLDTMQTFTPTEFSIELQKALRDLNVPEQVVDQINHIDTSNVGVHIVTSVPSRRGWQVRDHADAYGMAKLAKIAQKLYPQPSVPGNLDIMSTNVYCYGSSMGRPTNAFLRNFFCYSLGMTWDEIKRQTDSQLTEHEAFRRVKVGFHTNDQGNSNKFGLISRMSIKCQQDSYFDKSFPVDALYKIEPAVPHTLVHAKVVLMRMGPGEHHGWMYLGSHNFTAGAWGNVSTTQLKLTYVNNYEFGVVLPEVRFDTVFGRDHVVWRGSKVPMPVKLSWSPYSRDDFPCFNNDVSDNLEQQLKIASDIEVSAQADASIITDGEVAATKRRKVDFNNHSAEHTELDISSNEEGLPPGFFDEGIEPLEDDADMGNDDGNIAGTPAAQSKVSKPELSTTTPNKELLDDLAAFETEIAELVDPEEPLTDNLASTAVNQEDVLDGQAKEWSERTQHLAHLQSIIKQGLEELDPNESKSDMDEGSDESSEDEYSEFTNWRTGQL